MAYSILVVEDDQDGAEMVGMILNGAGLEVWHAPNPQLALGWLSEGAHFDAAIFDLALPGMDGMELLQHMRQLPNQNSGLKTIAVTAYHTPELKARSLDSGFDGYLPKPLDTMNLLRTLDRLLNT